MTMPGPADPAEAETTTYAADELTKFERLMLQMLSSIDARLKSIEETTSLLNRYIEVRDRERRSARELFDEYRRSRY
jgi:hypothetical protein